MKASSVLLTCFFLIVPAFAPGFTEPGLARGSAAAADVVADMAAIVLRLQGSALAHLPDGPARALSQGAELYVGEKVVTGDETRLRIRLIDGAVITLGDHSTFTLVGYEPESRGMVLDLVEGVFRAVSGALADGRPRPVLVRTPLGSIGVRGTTFWGRQQLGHLEVALLEGEAVFVESRGVRIVLDEPGEGTDILAGQRPTPAQRWGQQRLDASAAMVAFP